MHYNGKAIFIFKFITNKKRKWFHCISIHTLIWNSLNLALDHSYSLNYTSSGVNLWQIQLIWKGTHVLTKGLPANNAYNAGGGWGETPHMIVKRFGCTTIQNKVLYKCIIHSFIRSFVHSFIYSFISEQKPSPEFNRTVELRKRFASSHTFGEEFRKKICCIEGSQKHVVSVTFNGSSLEQLGLFLELAKLSNWWRKALVSVMTKNLMVTLELHDHMWR